MLKVYTQAEVDAIQPDENGVRHFPSGDYSQVKSFGEGCRFCAGCVFGECCSFGKWCSFGEECSFGEGCRFCAGCVFGECCSFGEWCRFGEWCSFGEECSFGRWCSFGQGCRFGPGCIFSKGCRFGEVCSFGELCRFGEGCSHEGLANSRYFACDRIGSAKRKAYFFASNEGLHVRAGCFFGTMDEFIKKVRETHGGTRYEKEYLAAAELAKMVLAEDSDGK